MYSRAHAAIGAAVSLPLVLALWPRASLATGAALWAYGVALSVLLDLDHFVVTRARVGDWRHLRRVLADPTAVLWEQDWVFDDGDLAELDRLLAHAVVGGVLVGVTWFLAPALAVLTAVVLYVHVLADLLRDTGLG